jgi:hypothetical protein
MTAIMVTDAGLNLIRDGNHGTNSPKITYVALGTNSATPATSDTLLGAEVFRKPVTAFTNSTTGELVITMYLAPGEAVSYDIEEIGFFGGSTATSARNTGILIARGLYSHNPKSNVESIQFSLDLSYTRS